MSNKDLTFEDLDDNFFGDGLTEAAKDPFSLSSIVGLGIAGLGLVGGAVAVKRAVDKKKAREKLQKAELEKLMKELEEINNMKTLKTFDELNKMFMDKTLSAEQDDIPAILKSLREQFKEDIQSLKPKDRQTLMEDDNWF